MPNHIVAQFVAIAETADVNSLNPSFWFIICAGVNPPTIHP
ncbi:MAG: hypothetical protein AAF289_10030 [Cyanobacteria bacterium P01_A01_bin.135]